MYIIYNEDGSIKAKQLNEFIQQGNSYVNLIKIAIENVDPSDYQLIAHFELSNGAKENVYLSELCEIETIDGTFSGRSLSLSKLETALDGTLKVNIQALENNTDKILTSYTVYLSVNSGVDPGALAFMSQEEYQHLINTITNYKLEAGRFLSLWDAETGTALSNPPTDIYRYQRGDYFRVAIGGDRIPVGSQYDVNDDNYETSTTTVNPGDIYFYDGTVWIRQVAGSDGTVIDVRVDGESVVEDSIANITGVAKTSYLSNPNLLINPDFKVNQRGLSTLTNATNVWDNKYFVDRWCVNGSFEKTSNGLSFTDLIDSLYKYARAYQFIEDFSYFWGKPLTLSASINGIVYSVSGILPAEPVGDDSEVDLISKEITIARYKTVKISLTYFPQATTPVMAVIVKVAQSTGVYSAVVCNWVKLEISPVATTFVPPLQADEFIRCQRYYKTLRGTQDNYEFRHSTPPTTPEERYSVFFRISHQYDQMRAIPEVSWFSSDPSDFNVQGQCMVSNTQNGIVYELTFEAPYINSSLRTVQIEAWKSTSLGITAANIYIENNYIIMDAEIKIEL